MDYSRIVGDSGFYFYQDKSFNTVTMELSFHVNSGNKNDAIYNVLGYYLMAGNEVFDEAQVDEKVGELYSIIVSFYSSCIGKQDFLNFNVDMISPNIISEDNYFHNCVSFCKTMLERPKFDNQELLDSIKRKILSDFRLSISDPSNLADKYYYSKVLVNPIKKYEQATDAKYVEQVLDSITLSDLKNAYYEAMDNFYNGYVFGNLEREEFDYLKGQFPYKYCGKSLDYSEHQNVNRRNIVIPSNSQESVAYVTYQLGSYSREFYLILDDILNDSYSLCDKILRNKYDLVYESGAYLYFYKNLLVINGLIDKKNYQKFIQGVDEIITSIQNPNIVRDGLQVARRSLKRKQYLMSEDIGAMEEELKRSIDKSFGWMESDELIRRIDSFDEEKFICLTKTLKKQNEFLYRGDNHE